MVEGMIEDQALPDRTADDLNPDISVHLAVQAGVRCSLENPRAYLDSSVIGMFNVMEAARRLKVKHLLMASTSSIYGAIIDMPFAESQKADAQLTIYAATKKANESMGHAYAHLYDLPTTMFRFFTVYGPWSPLIAWLILAVPKRSACSTLLMRSKAAWVRKPRAIMWTCKWAMHS